MVADRPTPSLVRVLYSDYVAGISLIGVVVMWGLHIAASFGVVFKSRSRTELSGDCFFWIAVVATVTLLPLLAYRVHEFRTVFKRGSLCKGEITSIWFHRDRGRVEFRYSLDGQEYNTGSPIGKNARTKTLGIGQEVDLVVDPKKPSRAFIIALYT